MFCTIKKCHPCVILDNPSADFFINLSKILIFNAYKTILMRNILPLILCFFALSAAAQKVHFESDVYSFPANAESFTKADWSQATFNNKRYAVVQFSRSVSKAEREVIQLQTGILFFDYIPRYAFIASIPSSINTLAQYDIKSVTPYLGEYKLNHQLGERPLPDWTKLGGDKIQIDVTFHNDIYKSLIEYQLGQLGMEITAWQEENLAVVQLNENQLEALTKKAYVKYMQPTSAPGIIENDQGRTSHRTNVLDAEYLAGRHFTGNGITVSMGDDGNVGPHIDFQGRLQNLGNGNGGTHGDHVLGIIGAAGNFDPTVRGNAAGADLTVYNGYGNINNVTADYSARGVRITANSLGQGCNSGYNNNARTQDQRINANYSMMSVHSSGNSGTSGCGFVNGYYVITGGYKAGKNCLATGNLVKDDQLAGSSSRGPARDGRIKPDLCAVGTSVLSTAPGNTYSTKTGTSMACPGLAGTLASLWEAYKITNGQEPYSAVMKGIALNTADDLGRPGPDFQYGWGRINARKALQVIDSNQFMLDTIMNGQTETFNVVVPPNSGQAKFMLYWHDPAGAANAAMPLVNDLNLTATAPNTFTFNPWVLDYSQNAASLSSNAVRGRDSVNNAEQITVKNPQPGSWTINVEAFDVPSGPQSYVLVYYFEPKGITLTYPQGGEHFNAGQTERVRWDANDINTPITLEYSSDNGTSWNIVSSGINSDQRYFDWTPPGLATGEMLMRVSRGSEMDVSDAPFTVYQQVQNLNIDTACPTKFHLTWDAVGGATDYTIYQLGARYMDSIGTSTTNDFSITQGVNTLNTFYFAVRANNALNGAKGRRSLAYVKQPGEINCGDDLFNVRTEIPYNQAYDCAPNSNVPVTMTVKNISLTGAIISNIPVSYDINGITAANETIPGPIMVGDSIIFTFTQTANFPTAGSYVVQSRCSYPFDGFAQNDISSTVMNILPVPIVLPPLVQDFEGSFTPTDWRVINEDNGVPWQKTFALTGAVQGNTHTAYMDFYNYTGTGQQDILESPEVDLQNVTSGNVEMLFDVSHAQRNGSEDRLEVLMSEDCGQTWQPTGYDKAGGALATTVSSNTAFSPTLTTEWRSESIDLSAHIGKELIFRFVGTNNNGNNLYIDNINLILKATPLGINEFEKSNFKIYPNPSDGRYVLKSKLDKNTQLFYSVKDLSGRTITKSKLSLSAGVTQSAIDITYLPSGMYMLELYDGKSTEFIKLTKK